MKIFLLNYEFPPLGGGAGNATKNIAREMSALGHSVCVLTTWFEGLPENEFIDGYRIIRLHSRRKRKDRSNIFEMFHYVWSALLESKKIISEFNPDVVVSFFAIPTGIIAFYLKVRYKIPYIISLRGGDVPGFLRKNLKYHHILSMPFTNMVWRNSSDIVANSKGLKTLAEKTARKLNKGVEYIPNGVNNTEFYPAQIEKESNKLNILFVGRLTEQKGVKFILNALKDLVLKNHDVEDKIDFTIIGDGPTRGDLENQTKELGLENVVTFLGWITKDQLTIHYQKADIFILPSFEEGMPNVILEAIASGVAIIATDIGGNNELVDNNVNGFLYKDQDELPGLINNFIQNPSLKKEFGKESFEKSKSFSWIKVTKEYIDLCQKIL